MKKTLTGFAIVLVAALWMTGSWVFFNSIALGASSFCAVLLKKQASGWNLMKNSRNKVLTHEFEYHSIAKFLLKPNPA